ncbi:MAG: MOMP family protein [Simkania sp.]|nr:MOMP family protein [Simkania sp.]MCB1075614.1 MOMP family protein [Simkania sp.]MCP5489957.1 MOMP family protein [Chlamydiales bacterium]
MKKAFQAMTLAFAAICGNAVAEQNATDMGPPPNRDIMTQSAHGCLSEGFSFQAEFLWWRAIMDDLEYAIKAKEPLPIFQPFPAIISGDVKEPQFNFEPGVRLAAGYDFGRDNWDLFLTWTYHYTKATDRFSPIVADPTIEPLTSMIAFDLKLDILDNNAPNAPNFGNLIITADGSTQWQVRLNTLDFESGYDYFFSHRFSIRPHLGLKAAWIDMHYQVKYNTMLIVHNFLNDNLAHGSGRGDSDYWSVGPLFGLDGYLHIGWGFSLYGKISGALLYGEYDTKYRIVVDNLTDPSQNQDITVRQDSSYHLRPMSQLAMGLEWGYCFSQNYFLGLYIGWETQYWWNQLEIPVLTSFQPDGDLTFSGLDVGIRFDF